MMLIDAITHILESSLAGLTEREIRRAVIEHTGLRCQPPDVRAILRSSPDRFLALADGIWRLRAVVESEAVAAGVQTLPRERKQIERPLVTHLPDLDTCIVLHLVTTGPDPVRNRIVQITAVRFVQGKPAPGIAPDGSQHSLFFSSFIDLEEQELSHSLAQKLGYADPVTRRYILNHAQPVERVMASFRTWIGDVPLVAHTMRLDQAFLTHAGESIGWTIENPLVDTMELACLALPNVPARLDVICAHIGISSEQVAQWASDMGWPTGDSIGLHQSVDAVLRLAIVLPHLLQLLRQRLTEHPGLAWIFYRLFPQAANQLLIPVPSPHESPSVLIKGLVTLPLSDREQHPLSDREQHPPLPDTFSPEIVRQTFMDIIARYGLKLRTTQLQMAEAISHGLSTDRFLAIEAPTGTGKTLAYLIPGILWARSQHEPVVISTYTRLLQDQIAADLKQVRAMSDVAFQAQVLKGRQNYLCLERTAAIFAQINLEDLDEEERFAWMMIVSWLAGTNEGVLDELPSWAISTFPALTIVRDALRAEPGECSHERCTSCAFCFYQQAYSRAKQAHLIIMNHALLLSREWSESGLSFARVIVDEAHTFEDAATDAATDDVSLDSMTYLINRLLDTRSGQGVLIRMRDKIREADGQALIAVALHKRNSLATLAQDFGFQLKRYMELNHTAIDPRYGAKLLLEADPRKVNPISWKPAQDARKQLITTLRDTAEVIRQLLTWVDDHPLPLFHHETINELRYLMEQLDEQADLLYHLLHVGYDRLTRVHWIEIEQMTVSVHEQTDHHRHDQESYRWAVKCAPVRVGAYLAEHVYVRIRTLVLTSATLRTTRESGFGFLLDRLGLSRYVPSEDTLVVPPELNYRRALFAVARYMRADARPAEIQNFVDEAGQELGWFFRFTGGNGLVLCTARMRMHALFHALAPVLEKQGIPVNCQGVTGTRYTLLDAMKTVPGSVLLGLKSFWEGVDVPGRNLCYVVMEKLPFPLLHEPIVRARAAELRARGGHDFSDYMLPLMLIDFKQGFGRLIRSETDSGVVLLLDKRVWNREYYRDVLAALPGMDLPGNANVPVVLDDRTQQSRRAVYRAIADHMAQAPAGWQIDLDHVERVLNDIPEDLFTRLEQVLADLQVPDRTPVERLHDIWDRVIRALNELFHMQEWRSQHQETVVRAMLAGQDVLVILPTGSGKSLTFQLPALLRHGITLVFSPLKALMKDQVDKLWDLGLSVVDRLDSTQTAEEQERVYQRMREGTLRLVYIAPERARDPKLIAALRSATTIMQIVVDEAHCVHMWGQSFRPDFLAIARLVDTISTFQGQRPPVAALTATATPRIREAIVKHLALHATYAVIEQNPNRPEIRFVVYNQTSAGVQIRSKRDKLRILVQILRGADRQNENAIVYVNTTHEAERLARRLETLGLDVRFYHGRMDDQARKDVQDVFLDGQIRTIVATKAFGMGIDKADIRYVIHYHIPGDMESYYQEAGRAGRDGHVSYAVLLYHTSDIWIHENYFIPRSLPDKEQLSDALQWLRQHWGPTVQPIYIDPERMMDALGLDEDRELGMYLHVLEEQGMIQRQNDITLKASARLLVPRDHIVAALNQMVSADIALAVIHVIDQQGVTMSTRREVRVIEGSQTAGIAPGLLDEVFYQLALDGLMIYRAFARAYTLLPGSRLLAGNILTSDPQTIQAIQADMQSNLNAIRHYAESLTLGDCLREAILHYLGAEKPPTRADSCCSLCDVNIPLPWLHEPVWPDVIDTERYQDTLYVTLKAIGWNATLAESPGRAPYGIRTLIQILLGNDYMATRYEHDPQRKRARRYLIMTSAYFGVLEGLRGGEQTIRAGITSLQDDGLVMLRERQWERGTYHYLVPTDRGWERVQTGKLFEHEPQDEKGSP